MKLIIINIFFDRYCNKLDVYNINGFNKLFEFFIENYNPNKIIGFSNIRYDNGYLYESLGFKKIKINPPDYTYSTNNKICRYNKHILIKKLNIDENDDEFIINNYYKIYDCGNIEYHMNF